MLEQYSAVTDVANSWLVHQKALAYEGTENADVLQPGGQSEYMLGEFTSCRFVCIRKIDYKDDDRWMNYEIFILEQ